MAHNAKFGGLQTFFSLRFTSRLFLPLSTLLGPGAIKWGPEAIKCLPLPSIPKAAPYLLSFHSPAFEGDGSSIAPDIKSLEEREEQYAKARERIFNMGSDTASPTAAVTTFNRPTPKPQPQPQPTGNSRPAVGRGGVTAEDPQVRW